MKQPKPREWQQYILITDTSVMAINLPPGRQGDHGTAIRGPHTTAQALEGVERKVYQEPHLPTSVY